MSQFTITAAWQHVRVWEEVEPCHPSLNISTLSRQILFDGLDLYHVWQLTITVKVFHPAKLRAGGKWCVRRLVLCKNLLCSQPLITLDGSVSYTFPTEGLHTVTVQVAAANTILQDTKTIAVKGQYLFSISVHLSSWCVHKRALSSVQSVILAYVNSPRNETAPA